jgi:pimeloyl-ACP methyl ester carboxylesterase
MIRFGIGIIGALALVLPAAAQVQPFPKSFHTQEIKSDGAVIHVRVGGKGPAVVLLHGYGETGDMWAPMAADLARDHTVVVPDLRGLGLSSKPAGGFDKKTQAGDVVAVLDKLKIDRADLVTHDIGNMVGFAFAMQHPERVVRFALIDAPVPGIGPWEEILKNPLLWHFRFGGPDMERLVAGRERIYLDRFWNEFSATPSRFTEKSRRHYARLYALPGAMHSGASTRPSGPSGNRSRCIAGRAARDDAEARALLGDDYDWRKVRGEAERPAAVHHRDRRARHSFHSRSLEA